MNLKGSVALISENTTCSGHHSKNNHYGLYSMELMQQSLLLPRHQAGGLHGGELLWKLPSASAIYEIGVWGSMDTAGEFDSGSNLI